MKNVMLTLGAALVLTVAGCSSEVDETEVKTLVEGDGEVVAPTATVTVCYLGVNGRTGERFDGNYREGGSPATFSLDGVIQGFSKAIAGQKVGSQVASR